MNVGLVGIGTMGILIASRLVKAGYRAIACDVDPVALQRARELGAVPADTPQNVAEQAEIILLALPGPAQIETVVAGERGLLAGARSGQVFVDLSKEIVNAFWPDRLVMHDAEDTNGILELGTDEMGNAITCNRLVAEADLAIMIGHVQGNP